jgi:hypothetical protein
MSKSLSQLANRLIRVIEIYDEKEAYNTVLNALDDKIENSEAETSEQFFVNDIRSQIEKEFELPSGSLKNSFNVKDRCLTTPKLIWVIVVLNKFNFDRAKAEKLIGNGIHRQKIYTCIKEYRELSNKVPHDKLVKQKIDKFINL